MKNIDLTKDKARIEKKFKDGFKDDQALLLDFVKPKKELGVHSFDIITHKCPDGSHQVFACSLWGGCDGDTSHSTTAGFTIDL